MLLNGYDWAVIAAFFVLLALIPTLASLKSRGTAGDFFNSGTLDLCKWRRIYNPNAL